MNPKVDFYFSKAGKWQKELEKLRDILLGTKFFGAALSEELKWGVPCYTFQNSNIVLVHVFKTYCAVLFFKGALMKDRHKILIRQTENVQAARQIRFTTVQDIEKLKPALKAYIKEAIEIEKAGLKVPLKKSDEFSVPQEFKDKLAAVPGLERSFTSLTPGRQRAYLLYFSAAKQSKTRSERVEKCIPQIFMGKGLND